MALPLLSTCRLIQTLLAKRSIRSDPRFIRELCSYVELLNMKSTNRILSLFMFIALAATASAASVTYAFQADVPTNDGPMPGSFVLTVPDFITGTPSSQFMGTDLTSCSAPGTGPCIAQFSVGPSPISGLANDIGFGDDLCCFIYFFPDMTFTTPGTYTADPFHSAGNATLTVSVSDAPEPSTFGLAAGSLFMVGWIVRKRWSTR